MPLYGRDRLELDRAIAKDRPGTAEVTLLARLRLRYLGRPEHRDVIDDIDAALDRWQQSVAELNRAARAAWGSGWRPGEVLASDVGSGADVMAG